MDEPQVPRQPDADAQAIGDHPCPWCAAAVPPQATTCPACGAAVAQRESIGDLVIPGLTSVDPALQDFDKRPLHLRGPSASQGMAPAIIVGAMAGGPIGLAAIGGVAAVAAAEYLGAGGGGHSGAALEDVGKPSEIVLRALERLDDGSLPAAGGSTAGGSGEGAEVDAGAADDGRSIWRDLPAIAGDVETGEATGQDEEGAADGG